MAEFISYITERNVMAVGVALGSVFFLIIAWNVLDIWITYQLSRHMSFFRYLTLLVKNLVGNIFSHVRLGRYYRTFSETRAMNMVDKKAWEIVGMSKDKRYFKLKRVRHA